jgi:hypothetical protein
MKTDENCVAAPKLMSVLYGMVQPFLAEETRTKIHVLGSKDVFSQTKYLEV